MLKSHFCGTALSPFRVGLVSEVMRVLSESQGTPTLEAVALSHLLLASPLPPALHLVIHLLSSPLAASSNLLSHLAKGRVAMGMHFAFFVCVCEGDFIWGLFFLICGCFVFEHVICVSVSELNCVDFFFFFLGGGGGMLCFECFCSGCFMFIYCTPCIHNTF